MSKRMTVFAVLAGLFWSTSALAEPIVLLVEGGGSVMIVTLNDDGTYTSDKGVTGTWKIDGDSLCVKRDSGESNCMPYSADAKPGDSWQSENANGEPVTITRQ